jgi:hypothetical protein
VDLACAPETLPILSAHFNGVARFQGRSSRDEAQDHRLAAVRYRPIAD